MISETGVYTIVHYGVSKKPWPLPTLTLTNTLCEKRRQFQALKFFEEVVTSENNNAMQRSILMVL